MKNSFLKISLLLCVIALFSFQRKTGNRAPGKPHPMATNGNVTNAPHRYEFDSAIADIDTLSHYYNDLIQLITHDSTSKPIPIRAFTISDTDLFYAMGFKPPFPVAARFKNIRVYLGFNTTSSSFKLFVVPVKSVNFNNPNDSLKAGSDLLFGFGLTGIYVDTVALQPHNDYVMDLNYPCPSFCDWSSGLMRPTTTKFNHRMKENNK